MARVTDTTYSTLEITETAFYRLPARIRRLIELYHTRASCRNGIHYIEMCSYRVTEIEAAMREGLEKTR